MRRWVRGDSRSYCDVVLRNTCRDTRGDPVLGELPSVTDSTQTGVGSRGLDLYLPRYLVPLRFRLYVPVEVRKEKEDGTRDRSLQWLSDPTPSYEGETVQFTVSSGRCPLTGNGVCVGST